MPSKGPSSSDADVWPALREAIYATRRFGVHLFRNERLSMGQYFLIHKIEDADGARLSTLASILGISRPAITSIVTSLEDAGLVRRERSTADRRGVIVRLTPRGAALAGKFDREFGRVVRAATAVIPASDRRPTVATLRRVSEAMELRTSGSRVVARRGTA